MKAERGRQEREGERQWEGGMEKYERERNEGERGAEEASNKVIISYHGST